MKITEKQAEEIRHARACGIPPKLLANYYGISVRRVQQLCHKAPQKSSVTEVVVKAC